MDTRKHRINLDFKSRSALADLVRARYVTDDLDDAGFAELAELELHRPITEHNVAHVRKMDGILRRDQRIAAQAEAEAKRLAAAATLPLLTGVDLKLAQMQTAIDALAKRVYELEQRLKPNMVLPFDKERKAR